MTSVNLATPDAMRAKMRRLAKLKGRQANAESMDVVRACMGERPVAGYPRDMLIEYLHKLQDAHRGLHEDHLVALAKLMNIPMSEVYEVATFYHHFDVLRAGDTAAGMTVRVCDSLSCEMAGAKDLMARLPAILGSEDVRVIAAPCLGRCEQAPVVAVHQNPIAKATADKVVAAVKAGKTAHAQSDQRLDYIDYAAYLAAGGYQLLSGLDSAATIKTMEDSGLRGLGGAGFPSGRKWRIVQGMAGEKLMAVNIDEGEPGTFKDRTYLERDPHRFLEGMLIAAKVVGIERCYIYLRDEYHGCREILEREVASLEAKPPVALQGALPAIHIRRGAGAYICGEESAMIESIEGKRGEPRMRPPFIAEVGLFGKPTLEHNFETLYWVREILEKGASWFTNHGRNGRKGLRSFSVSGRVKNPGVKLAPAGITLRELIDEYCGGMMDGHTLYAYLPGGASGGILPASMDNIPLDFDTLQPYGCFIGSAAVMVMSQHDKARDAALNIMRFFEHESCGQCTPCRVGTSKAAKLMEAKTWDGELLEDLAQVMGDASICGLGQAAPNPIRSIQKHFAHEIN
ncbi:MAG: NAD(P)H-dependent oxidoreductase subunit E [Cytophagales bacterium]|nr:NAD(P)H-dependent oxidoreductase subunit E [Cytophagales bacterium]